MDLRHRCGFLCGNAALIMALIAVLCPREHVAAGSSAAARGADLFNSKGCAHCHGPAGVGGTIGPDLQLVRKRLDAHAIAQQIHDGGKAMPAFGDSLTAAEIDDLVAYLRQKRKFVQVPAPPTDTP